MMRRPNPHRRYWHRHRPRSRGHWRARRLHPEDSPALGERRRKAEVEAEQRRLFRGALRAASRAPPPATRHGRGGPGAAHRPRAPRRWRCPCAACPSPPTSRSRRLRRSHWSLRAKRSNPDFVPLDCFVAALLAMTATPAAAGCRPRLAPSSVVAAGRGAPAAVRCPHAIPPAAARHSRGRQGRRRSRSPLPPNQGSGRMPASRSGRPAP